MRQLKILTRILLILSTINFALAAPVEVRERPEERLDADVTRNVRALSQKRWLSDDEGELPLPISPADAPAPPPPAPDSPGSFSGFVQPNVDHAPPPSPYLTDSLSQMAHTLWSLPAYADRPPPTPDTGSSPASDHVLPPVPSQGHAPPDSTDVWAQILQIAKQMDTPPSSPESMAGSLSPPLHSPHSSQQGPSEDRFQGSSGFSVRPGTLSSTGDQLTPPQDPGVDPETHSLLNPEPFPTGFWEELWKGKIKRRMSSSDAVNLA
ncbi:hypothetical protein BGY98DRAFT_1096415 [Russula aff. rugulosa BPL654]|nr:hypothetical protein BGY98DRAFT_1096415 [Russula aff. rugulosa BPL654]